MRNGDNTTEKADRIIHIRVTPTMADALKTEMSMKGYREMSSYVRSILDRRNGGQERRPDLSKGAVTAIEHLSSEIRRIGVLYNQFVAAYNRAVAMKNPDGSPRVTAKETQRNQLGLMDLTVQMTRRIHALMDRIGVDHDEVTVIPLGKKEEEKPSAGRIVIPKL